MQAGYIDHLAPREAEGAEPPAHITRLRSLLLDAEVELRKRRQHRLELESSKTMVRHEKLGWISDGGRRRLYPRCGAFEVSLHYRGERQKIFSKLDEQKWPNPDWLARRILKTVDEKEADFEARNPQFSRDMSPPASTSSSFGRVPMLKAPSETDISTTVPSEAPAIGDSELLSSEASAPRFGATKAPGPAGGTEPGDMIDVSAVADAETMQLRFRHLDYDNVDHKYFKQALLSGLKDLGLTETHADTLQIRLSKGSILAEISGPLPSMQALKSLPLTLSSPWASLSLVRCQQRRRCPTSRPKRHFYPLRCSRNIRLTLGRIRIRIRPFETWTSRE